MTARRAGTPLLLAGLGFASFLSGLAAGALRTGRADPLDWLWPSLAVIAIIAGYLRRSARVSAAMAWLVSGAMLVLPPLLFIGLACTRLPVAGAVMLVVAVGLVCGLGYRAHRAGGPLWPLLAVSALLALLPSIADRLGRADHSGSRLPVAVLSGPALFGADVPASRGEMQNSPNPAAADVAARAPFWAALSSRMALRPIDALDERALANVHALLLVQPRMLQPRELVTLDAWVRLGGRAVILADPLLAWPDARPLGNIRRAPMTSLLDPLLTHWGLALEPARIGEAGVMEERRLLASGHLLNLAAASRFTLLPGSDAHCTLDEGGLIALCRPGQGHVTLIADADFIEDRLWTIDPDKPERRAAWISDAVPLIESALTARPPDSPISWLIDGNRLLSGFCLASLLLMVLAGFAYAKRAFPMPSHGNESEKTASRGS